ncbi:MAG: hypothetical protein M3Y56_09490 [Armatimonadota bacterium]|nr:hypothetical protein [Armatimonadota bacterium]
MSLREFVAHEVETLGEHELQAVANFSSFLKFRSHTSFDEVRLSTLYAEFQQKDDKLAETGMADYAKALLSQDDCSARPCH